MKFTLFKKANSKSVAKGTKKLPAKKKLILSRKQKVLAGVAGVLVIAGAGYAGYAAYTMDEVGAGGCVSNVYKKGAVKTCVKYAQQMLGISSADSSFGTDTYNKVKSFQSKHGLTADGIVGPKTWSKLCSKGVNATAKKKAGCDGTSNSSSKEKTGWTNLGNIDASAYNNRVWADVRACKTDVRNGRYVVKANVSKSGAAVDSNSSASIILRLSDGSSKSDNEAFRKSVSISKGSLSKGINVTLTSGIKVSGTEKFSVDMVINGYVHGMDGTAYRRVDSLLTCS